MNYYITAVLTTILFFSVNICSYSQSKFSIDYENAIELENLKLEEDYTYLGFSANQNYLAWWEAYTLRLYIYDLNDKSYDVVQLERGRGPNEVNRLTDLFISSDNVVHLLDQPNAKFIRIDIEGNYFDDLSFPNGEIYSRMRGYNDTEVLMNLLNTESIFFLRENDSDLKIELEMNMMDEFPAFFHKLGWFSVNKNILVHQTQYYPYLYVYDIDERSLIKKIEFDESEVEEIDPAESENGAMMMFPPAEVDILNRDIIHVPNNQYRVLMLSEGKSNSKEYRLDALHEYDLSEEVFITTHNLGINAKSITSNEEFIFVYSEDDFTIYIYQINY